MSAIRNSYRTAARYFAMSRQTTAIFPQRTPCRITVSYTHLDVYKRQIQHLAHRRDSLRCDLYQIEPCVLSSTHGHLNADHTFLLAVCSDQANLTVTDLTVDLQFLRLSSGSDDECTSKQ